MWNELINNQCNAENSYLARDSGSLNKAVVLYCLNVFAAHHGVLVQWRVVDSARRVT